MARVSPYQQGRLASSLVGTPGVDNSMMQIAQAGLGSAVALANTVGVGVPRGSVGGGANAFGQIGNAINRMMQAKAQRQQMIDAGDFNNYKLEFGQALEEQAAEARQQARVSGNPVESMKTLNQQMLERRKEFLADPRLQGRSAGLVNNIDSFLTSKIGGLTSTNFEFADQVSMSQSDLETVENLRNISQLPYHQGYTSEALKSRLSDLGGLYQNLLRTNMPVKAGQMIRGTEQEVWHNFFEGKARHEGVDAARKMLYEGTGENRFEYADAIGSEGLEKLENAFKRIDDINNQKFNMQNKVSMVEFSNKLHDTYMSYHEDDSIEAAENAYNTFSKLDKDLRDQYKNTTNDREKVAIGERLSNVQNEQSAALRALEDRRKTAKEEFDKQQKERLQADKDSQTLDLIKISEMTKTEPARAFNAAEAKVQKLMLSEDPADKENLQRAIKTRDAARETYNKYRVDQQKQQQAVALQKFNSQSASNLRMKVGDLFNQLDEMRRQKADPNLMISTARQLSQAMDEADNAGALHPPGSRSVRYENMRTAISGFYRAAAGQSNPSLVEQMFGKITRQLPSDLQAFTNSFPADRRDAVREQLYNAYYGNFDKLKEKNPGIKDADIARILKAKIFEKFSGKK